ncbi:hypothetical protein HDU86_005858 [Geranomyces michiganensis]|nr:hypothetical protein HDU86_005858 [Geranomyces michiganensis]
MRAKGRPGRVTWVSQFTDHLKGSLITNHQGPPSLLLVPPAKIGGLTVPLRQPIPTAPPTRPTSPTPPNAAILANPANHLLANVEAHAVVVVKSEALTEKVNSASDIERKYLENLMRQQFLPLSD